MRFLGATVSICTEDTITPSRGTQPAAYTATELSGAEGPDGVVLTSTILGDNHGRPVPPMPLHKMAVPVLAVHHEQDVSPEAPGLDLLLPKRKA